MKTLTFKAASFLTFSLVSLASLAQPTSIDLIEVTVHKGGKILSGPVLLALENSSAASARILTVGQVEVACNADQPRSMKVVDRELGVRLNAARNNGAIQVDVQILDFDEQHLPENGHLEKCSAISPSAQRTAVTRFTVPSSPKPILQMNADVGPGFHVVLTRSRID
ncbi:MULTISPECIES: hypothetical protein [unclassified Variovorax]|uniref:hypothetical protein n=1 Tax=unclassified Variovorax TaxID=663243 RepID=UPI0032E56D33